MDGKLRFVSDTAGRLLRLLSLLQTHRDWTGPDLAERLDVSTRTIRSDVERLRRLGYPVHASPGVAGGYRLGAGAELPPLLLDDDEAVAIAVGLRTVASTSIEGIEETSLRALAKLEQVLPNRLRRRVNALQTHVEPLRWETPHATVDPESLAVLSQACRDGEQVRFDYADKDGIETRRLVEPYRLVPAGHRWYLVAWDVRRATGGRSGSIARPGPASPGGAPCHGPSLPPTPPPWSARRCRTGNRVTTSWWCCTPRRRRSSVALVARQAAWSRSTKGPAASV